MQHMKEKPWTPGPWGIDPDPRPDMEWNNHIVSMTDGNAICFMAHSGTPDNSVFEANARLISKAPELVEALEEFIEAEKEFRDATETLREECNFSDPLSDAYDRAKALLSEIYGEGE